MSTTTPLAGSSKDSNPGKANNIKKSGIAVGAGVAGAVAALAGDSTPTTAQDAFAGLSDNDEYQVYAIKREDAEPDIQPVEQPDEMTAEAVDAVPYAEVVAAAPDMASDWVASIDGSSIPHEAADVIGDNLDADVYVAGTDGFADDAFQVYSIVGENRGIAGLQDVAGNDVVVVDMDGDIIFDGESGYDGSVVVDVNNDFATATPAEDDAVVETYNEDPDIDTSDTSGEYVEDTPASDAGDDIDGLSPEHFA